MALHEHAYAEGRVGDSYRMAEISDSIRLEDPPPALTLTLTLTLPLPLPLTRTRTLTLPLPLTRTRTLTLTRSSPLRARWIASLYPASPRSSS